jgi:thiamine biosynthesis lipoprotein
VSATLTLTALGTTATLCTTDDDALAIASVELLRELERVDRACSRFRDDSELTELNRAAGTPFVVGDYLFEAVGVALRAAAATGGLVDPTIGRSLCLAGYDRTFELVGRGTISARFTPAAGWNRVEVDEKRRTIRLPSGSQLDLGATAKAFAADRAARAAAAVTGTGVLVALGGDVAVAGPPPRGGWPVRIGDDHREPLDAPGPVVTLESGGLATSSVRTRRWRTETEELHHILDPRTGRPAASCWRTATVAAAACVDANTASTAAILMGEAAPTWLERRHLPARLVYVDDTIVTTHGWPSE